MGANVENGTGPDYGPYDGLAPGSAPSGAGGGDGSRMRRVTPTAWANAGAAALLMSANGAAFAWMLFHLVSQYQATHTDPGRNYNFMLGSDIATPLLGWVWFQTLVNGVVLTMPRRTRAAGIGVLAVVAVTGAAVAVWVLLMLASCCG